MFTSLSALVHLGGDFFRRKLGFHEHAVGIQAEGGVQALNRLSGLRGIDHYGQANRARRDSQNVDVVLAQRLERLRGNAGEDFMPVPTRLTFAMSSSTM